MVRVWVVASLLVTAVGACGEEEATREQLKIGTILPLTGPVGDQGAVWEYAMLLAQQEINDAGGVLGKDLFLDVRDGQSNPDVAQALAEELLVTDDPHVLLHADITPTAIQILNEVAVGDNALVLSSCGSGDVLTSIDTEDLYFRSVVSGGPAGIATASFVAGDGYANIAVIREDNPYTTDVANGFEGAFTGTILESVHLAMDPPGPNDYTAAIATVEAASPDAIFLAAMPTAGMAVLSAWSLGGTFSGQWYLDGSLKASALLESASFDAEGMRGYANIGNPEGLSTVTAAMAATFGEAAGNLATNRIAEAYDAVYLLGLAIAKANTTDVDAMRDALRAVSNPLGTVVGPGEFKKGLDLIASGTEINYEGAAGSVDLDENGDVKAGFTSWKVQGGTFVTTGSWAP